MTKIDWSSLTTELALWRRDGLSLPLWWRDDDAIAGTPELARLRALSEAAGLPVHVAVIPDLIAPSLAPEFSEHRNLVPVVHGWRHISHAPKGAKNAEFGHMRDRGKSELASAYVRMREVFGPALVPLFVPPWNRISDEYLPELARCGFLGLSTYGPRASAFAAKGVVQINSHIDPIFWRGDRGLTDPEALVARLVSSLQARRAGSADCAEPLGLLTHHLVHTEGVWAFSRDLIAVLLDGGAAPADIGAILQAGRSPSI